MTLRVGVLISGNGSNLQALIDLCHRDSFCPVEIVHVLSNKADAYGLARAKEAGISTTVLNHKDFSTREAFDRAMDVALREQRVELVCMAGFMRLLTPWFVSQWEGRLLNIHPSLLPSFKGLDAQKQALEAGVRFSGCTVHIVTKEMDAGPILVQAVVPVYTNDTPEALAERIHKAEHIIYPHTLKLFAQDSVSLKNGRAFIKGKDASLSTFLYNDGSALHSV
ncbi:MAG: phosphoribosylglycinamide formyltransferase [Rickettsiales bacterium]|jgi:phosphoribosylglycinamide formyltransferase-1|nr:phosphoribosylglycinamide formyltransferase [Rickettsiales bacterium]